MPRFRAPAAPAAPASPPSPARRRSGAPGAPAPTALALALAAAALVPPGAAALEEARLLRQPDIQGPTIVFVHAGDLWTVSRDGGVASRLTSHEGLEQFPKLSPDGRTVAFTAEYDGNVDAFTMPVAGGEPTRLTWHPDPDRVAEWYPDGSAILLRSHRASANRVDRFFRIAATGGFEEPLPFPTAGYASFSPDGARLAFVTPSYDNRTWKRYRGGNAPEIWIHDLAANRSEKITDWEGADEWPMWHGRTVYYASDRGGRTVNLWAYDLDRRTHAQVTRFTDYDVKWPSLGGDAIVFEQGGSLWVLDLPGGTPRRISVLVPDDAPATRPVWTDVSRWIDGFDLSPSARRAVFAARGEIFTVPAEHGAARNLSNTPGARERHPAWSPDGRWIAFLSDRTGEYEFWVAAADGATPARQVTKLGPGFRFAPRWSPDSKKLAWSDATHTLWWTDVANGKPVRVDKSEHADITDFAWSADSRWIAYARTDANAFRKILLYALDGGRVTPVSEGMHDDFSPAFDPRGRWLYFLSRRRADLPAFAFEYAFPLNEDVGVYAVSLRDTVPSPVAPRSDEEGGGENDAKDGKDGDKGKDGKAGAAPLRIDLEGLGRRVVELPVEWGRYTGLAAFEDKLVFTMIAPPDPEAEDPASAAILLYDLEEREPRTVLDGVLAGHALSRDGSKVLYRAADHWGLADVEADQKVGEHKLELDLRARVEPRLEWRQMFEEAWRLQRDFYYDPGMGGLDWKAVGDRYRPLLDHVAHRHDLNVVLGELCGELSTSHAYVGGGAVPEPERVPVGLLGADWTLDPASGRYRIARLYGERDWNDGEWPPLGQPGLGVREGDWLLAVNGRPLRAPENLYAAFEGTAGRPTTLTIGRAPNDPKPRAVVVEPIEDESDLRYRAFVSEMRERVAAATGGRVAYIHIPNTALRGIEEFYKQYYPQSDRQGLIVDERWNEGGFIPDFFVERLARRTRSYWSTRYGDDFRTPWNAIDGPKAMLINQYAGSGGDALPWYFRQSGLGPLIGMRTWGGLVGISRSLPLVDGGVVTVPDFGFWNPATGAWEVENRGVEPDLEVENPPDALAAGRDPQLEAAIRYCLEQLERNPPKRPARPAYRKQPGLE